MKNAQEYEFDISNEDDNFINGIDKEDNAGFAIGDHIIAIPEVHFNQIIPENLLDLIIDEVENKPEITFNAGQIGNELGSVQDDEIRKCETSKLNGFHWACSIFYHYMDIANDQVWQYDLSHVEEVQVTRYEQGGHYTWHSDYGVSSTKKYTRKLSASLILSDPSEYEGGKLQLVDYFNNIIEPVQTKGSLIVFDSRIPHRVTPVTKGQRISLVSWMLGPKLR